MRSIGKKEISKLQVADVADHICQLGNFYLAKKTKDAETRAKTKEYDHMIVTTSLPARFGF
jgi:hypothetical protein